MRILLVADIHGNWPALLALNEPHDLCLVLGDLVDYGLEPSPCIDWVRRRAHAAIRGNHDHHTAQNVTISGKTGYRYLAAVTAPFTRQRISASERRFLADLPVTRRLTLDGVRILMVHGTPSDPLDEYGQPEATFWADRLDGVDADLVCVGHSHVPYVLQVGSQMVVNPGSLGVPRDGDPRAAYAVIDNGRVELKRVAYNVDATIRVVRESVLPDQAKELLAAVFRTGGGPLLGTVSQKPAGPAPATAQLVQS
jgi:putative phosphoesterase